MKRDAVVTLVFLHTAAPVQAVRVRVRVRACVCVHLRGVSALAVQSLWLPWEKDVGWGHRGQAQAREGTVPSWQGPDPGPPTPRPPQRRACFVPIPAFPGLSAFVSKSSLSRFSPSHLNWTPEFCSRLGSWAAHIRVPLFLSLSSGPAVEEEVTGGGLKRGSWVPWSAGGLGLGTETAGLGEPQPGLAPSPFPPGVTPGARGGRRASRQLAGRLLGPSPRAGRTPRERWPENLIFIHVSK